jgi:hypothetical protein
MPLVRYVTSVADAPNMPAAAKAQPQLLACDQTLEGGRGLKLHADLRQQCRFRGQGDRPNREISPLPARRRPSMISRVVVLPAP